MAEAAIFVRTGFAQPATWHALFPLVFYDGPGTNATDWSSHNYTVCAAETAPGHSDGCDEKYRSWLRSPTHFLQGFCEFHCWCTLAVLARFGRLETILLSHSITLADADLSAFDVFCVSSGDANCAASTRRLCAAA